MEPILAYDDDCHFCTWAATFAVERGDIEPVPLSRASREEYPRLPPDYEECAQLITDEGVYSCGAATERSLVYAGVIPEEVVEFLRQFSDYAELREALYHFMSDHRNVWSKVLHRDPPIRE